MELKDLIPKDGPQRAYCGECDGPLDLVFTRFQETVSGIAIDIDGLPALQCPTCGSLALPDPSRAAILRAHEHATKIGSEEFTSKRRKSAENFGFTDVPFEYDSDDYYYYPGLVRPWDTGFLTPIFFERRVLAKYDADPRYAIRYASPTYGDILADGFTLAFGINRHGKLILWLGDIAKLPKSEQYYLLSENQPSDHSLGSEFYDGQIEAIFTDLTAESKLFAARSEFLEAAFKRWDAKLAHLDTEVLDLAGTLMRPIYDTPEQRRTTADTLNKVHLESIDNKALGKLLQKLTVEAGGDGSLKRLEALMATAGELGEVQALLSPFYTLYDFRVAESHLGSKDGQVARMKTVTDRLGLNDGAALQEIYDALTTGMTQTYKGLTSIVKVEQADVGRARDH